MNADTLTAPPAPPVAPPELKAKVAKVARDYEASFLSIMLGQMQAGVQASSFGGGQGEDVFKSFLNDAMSKSMTARGGIGLAPRLATEMLRLQGFTA